MSAFEVSAAHIDALVSAALPGWDADGMRSADGDPMIWHYGEIPWDGDYEKWQAAVKVARREVTLDNAEQWGAVLLAENRRSVNYRYEEDEIEAPYAFTRNPGPLDPVKMLKVLACYEYQSCEHPEWKSSEAYRFCKVLEGRLIARLPGYHDAPWDIGDPSQVHPDHVKAA